MLGRPLQQLCSATSRHFASPLLASFLLPSLSPSLPPSLSLPLSYLSLCYSTLSLPLPFSCAFNVPSMAGQWSRPAVHARVAAQIGAWLGAAVSTALIVPPPVLRSDEDEEEEEQQQATPVQAAAAAAEATPFRWIAVRNVVPGYVVFCTVGVSDIVVHGTMAAAVAAAASAATAATTEEAKTRAVLIELRQEYMFVAKEANALVAAPPAGKGRARGGPQAPVWRPELVTLLYITATVLRREAFATSEQRHPFSYFPLKYKVADDLTLGGICTAAPAMLAQFEGSLDALEVGHDELPVQLVALVALTADECFFLRMIERNSRGGGDDDDDDDDDDEDGSGRVNPARVRALLGLAQREQVDLADLGRVSVDVAKDLRRKVMERSLASLALRISPWLNAFLKKHNVRANDGTVLGVRAALDELRTANVKIGGRIAFEIFCTFREREQLAIYVAVPARDLTDTKLVLAAFDELDTADLAKLVKLSTMPALFDDERALAGITLEHSDGKMFFNADVNDDPHTQYWDNLRNQVVAARRRRGQTNAPSAVGGAINSNDDENAPLLGNGGADADEASCCVVS